MCKDSGFLCTSLKLSLWFVLCSVSYGMVQPRHRLCPHKENEIKSLTFFFFFRKLRPLNIPSDGEKTKTFWGALGDLN
jgi:hypothetical protein